MYKTLVGNYTLEEAKEAQRLRAEEHVGKIVRATKLLIENGIEPGTCPISQADDLVYNLKSEELQGGEMDCDGDFESMSLYAECW